MGDVLTLIEKTQANFDQKKAKELERKFKKNEFTLTDFAEQMKAIKKMGSLGDLVGMIPGLKKVAGQVDSEESQRELKRIQAIIDSMTAQERENHLILNGTPARQNRGRKRNFRSGHEPVPQAVRADAQGDEEADPDGRRPRDDARNGARELESAQGETVSHGISDSTAPSWQPQETVFPDRGGGFPLAARRPFRRANRHL